LPNLNASILSEIMMFRANGYERRMVLAMRKRSLSHPSYTRNYQKLIDFRRPDHNPAMTAQAIWALPDLTPERNPARGAAGPKGQPALMLKIGKSKSRRRQDTLGQMGHICFLREEHQ
jgi:hypothetical protein